MRSKAYRLSDTTITSQPTPPTWISTRQLQVLFIVQPHSLVPHTDIVTSQTIQWNAHYVHLTHATKHTKHTVIACLIKEFRIPTARPLALASVHNLSGQHGNKDNISQIKKNNFFPNFFYLLKMSVKTQYQETIPMYFTTLAREKLYFHPYEAK